MKKQSASSAAAHKEEKRWDTDNLSLAADVAWLHLVQGLSQAEVADRRGMSRMKVHRLLQLAYERGYVRVFVDRVPTFCMELEKELMAAFGLSVCMVAPDGGTEGDMFSAMSVVSTAAASFLFNRLESTEPRTIGIGSGRTMAATVRSLPSVHRPDTSFVSLTGDFAVLNDANPFEVINTLIQKTGGKGHAFTAPLIVETAADRELFLRQRGMSWAMKLVNEADFYFTGLGHVGVNSFFESYSLLSKLEIKELRDLNVVADIAGNLLTDTGKFITESVALRTIGVSPAILSSHELIIVAGGAEKAQAGFAALKSGCVNGFITNEGMAKAILGLM